MQPQNRSRRPLMLLIVAILVLLIAGAAVLFLLQGIGGGGAPADTAGEGGTGPDGGASPTIEPTAPPSSNIVIANRDIRRGTRLDEADVTLMAWPMFEDAPPPAGTMVVDTGDPAEAAALVQGRIARVDILRGQPILDHMLTPGADPDAIGDTGSDAALLIPSGSVAYAIPITRLSSVAYAIRTGDHVDVMMSFRFVDVDEDFQTILPNAMVTFTLDPTTGQATSGSLTPLGRIEPGPLGATVIVAPNPLLEDRQRPRQATQLMIDNAVVLRVGTFPFTDQDAPIVVTPAPPPTPDPNAPEGAGGDPNAQPTPLPTAIPAPDVVTLVMSRQDALVLKFALETGALIDLALRSALDDEIEDVSTDTVTLRYIIDFYNLTIPPKLPVAQEPRIDDLDINIQPPGGATSPDATSAPGDFE